MNWKYTNQTNLVVFRILDSGATESSIVSAPEVQAWVLLGNTILSADSPTPEELAAVAAQEALAAAKAEAKADNVVQYLRDHTPAECADHAETLTNAQFRRATAMVLSVLSKESLR